MTSTILIIEDNEQNLYLMRFLLEASKYRVLEARSGQEGFDLLQSETPDLVLLDIQLPCMDGLEVARHLRENDALAKVPIVAVTSHAMAGDRERIIGSGCDGYIEKPINPNSFISTVEQYMNHRGSNDAEQE